MATDSSVALADANTIRTFFTGADTTAAAPAPPLESERPKFPGHLDSALVYTDLEEIPNNRGMEVEKFLESVGLKPSGDDDGAPWCAAFVSHCLNEGGDIISPPKRIRTAWARGFIIRSGISTHKSIRMAEVLRGTVNIEPGTLVVWKAKQDPEDVSGHIGMVMEWDDNCRGQEFCSGKTIEGNTSSGREGSQREGGGVFQRTRTIHLQPANHFRITHFTPVIYR